MISTHAVSMVCVVSFFLAMCVGEGGSWPLREGVRCGHHLMWPGGPFRIGWGRRWFYHDVIQFVSLTLFCLFFSRRV